MRYPWNFETRADVSIDADELVNYVSENWDWFVEHCSNNKDTFKDQVNYLKSVLDQFDHVRRFRDSSLENCDNDSVKLYNAIEQVKLELEKAL